ncbi:MAG: protein-disulfide reductase DsbD domain-containing protein [Phycisphaerales bacterium]|nr:MAG: protein-disulfide reductase DsbD N-terminal domain-containing protein [Phycisphaerales bacterium]
MQHSHIIALALAPIAMIHPSFAHADTPAEAHVSARLISETTALRAGSDSTIGVSLTIAKDWHIYGDTFNDTGMTPRFSWTVPQGVKVGEPIFPAPHRHVSPGDILDHIYEGTVTILFPVHVNASATIPKDATLGVSVDLLVCSDACIPETATASMPLAALHDAASAEASKDAPLIVASRERLPARVPSHKAVTKSTPTTLTLSVPRATSLTFYPATDIPTPINLIADGIAAKDALTIRFEAPESETEIRRVRGLLEFTLPDSKKPVFVSIDEVLPPVKAVPVSPSTPSSSNPASSKSTPASSAPSQPAQTPKTTSP